MSRKKVLVMQASLAPPGGGNGVTAWMIEALKETHAVTLLTWEKPELGEINRFFGTSIQPTELAVIEAVPPRFLRHVPLPLGLVSDFLLMRACRRLSSEFDVVLTGMNECDLGRPGVQYIHYPRFDPERPSVDLHWYHAWPAALRLYRTGAARLTGFSFGAMRDNVTLVNSRWTGARASQLHGFDTRTVYPPASGTFAPVRWEDRDNSFICIGRFSPEKRIERIVAILAEVRRCHPSLRLHVVGRNDDEAYTRTIRELARDHVDWIRLHENVSRDELSHLVSSCRYGIHAMANEHFGMAVAEMVRGGCIVFVPNDGGQLEIIGDEPALSFNDPAEAAEKILRILGDSTRQQSLRAHLEARSQLFSGEIFKRQIRDIVDGLPNR